MGFTSQQVTVKASCCKDVCHKAFVALLSSASPAHELHSQVLIDPDPYQHQILVVVAVSATPSSAFRLRNLMVMTNQREIEITQFVSGCMRMKGLRASYMYHASTGINMGKV